MLDVFFFSRANITNFILCYCTLFSSLKRSFVELWEKHLSFNTARNECFWILSLLYNFIKWSSFQTKVKLLNLFSHQSPPLQPIHLSLIFVSTSSEMFCKPRSFNDFSALTEATIHAVFLFQLPSVIHYQSLHLEHIAASIKRMIHFIFFPIWFHVNIFINWRAVLVHGWFEL